MTSRNVTPSMRWAGRVYGAIRTIRDAEGEPLFCAKDVCEALGYKLSRKAVQDHVDKEDVLKRNTLTKGGMQQMLYVNESGLYALILGSAPYHINI